MAGITESSSASSRSTPGFKAEYKPHIEIWGKTGGDRLCHGVGICVEQMPYTIVGKGCDYRHYASADKCGKSLAVDTLNIALPIRSRFRPQ